MSSDRAAERLRRRLADRTVVVVSPHLDDAGASAWWLLSQPDVHVVTVFTAPAADGAPSYWDLELGFSSSVEAIEARLAEDRRAIGLTGATNTHLGLRELAYRTADDEGVVTERIVEAVAGAILG